MPERSLINANTHAHSNNTSSDEDVLQFDVEQLISSDCTNATSITKHGHDPLTTVREQESKLESESNIERDSDSSRNEILLSFC